MSDAPSSGKTCVACGQDCAGKPRVKDKSGRYFCKPCHEKAIGKAAARQAVPVAAASADDAADGFGGFDNAAILADLHTPPAAAAASGPQCGGCGMPMAPGAVICTSCGFNTATGRGAKIKVTKESSGAAGEAAAKAAEVLWTKNPLAWALGGVIGAAVGSGIWALAVIQANFDMILFVWLVGITTGLGVHLVARGWSDSISGIIAGAIALVAIFGGRYLTVSFLVDKELGKQVTQLRLTDRDAQVALATDMAGDWETAGVALEWPDGWTKEDATEAEHFPKEIWTKSQARWSGWTDDEKLNYKRDKEAEFQEALGEIKGEVFKESLIPRRPKSLIVYLLALISAYSLGSGAGGLFGSRD